ncbi:CoA-dependent acyltransferase [Glarea lozoyensis ATCC 20868]|uniref:CoA-dependent acyltransferase n=1 Tax=Glarea lozoyensis (strain ATCC 20868 / MF5171) TaxID=1116229 RepID=S3DC49_GLAL2|nr:CoA-dependent acyltransferase [Glarea lozoyensis ATCC 20868]EPE35275.1 CoA-dependent acyltransferase [Glarea lozoyensis ATCC 20868]
MAKLAESKNFQDEVAVDVDQIIGDAVERVKFESGGAKLEELRESGAAEDVMPVTAGQLHMIRQWQASRGRLFYPTFSYQISGTLDKVALEQAWGKLCDRHAILRTGFIEVGDSVLQVVFKDPDNPVQYEESSVSHDLINPPLTLTIQNNNNKPLMKLRIHHALYDGISLPILLDDLHSLYVNINHAFPQPTSNFKQFIAQTLTSSSTTQEKWQSYLSSAPPKTRTKARHSNRTEIYHPSLPISSLKPRARELGISIDALLLASVAKKYAHHAHTAENLILGIYLANRAPFGEDLSSLAAPTLNLLPLLINDPLGRSVGDLAREIQHDVTRISNKDMIGASLDEIYNWTGVKVEGFVNIVKSPAQIPTESKPVWESIDENGDGAGEVEVRTDEKFPDVDESKVEAYPETLDIELRYHDFEGEAKIDIGVFAPGNRICLEDGEEFVRGFVGGF